MIWGEVRDDVPITGEITKAMLASIGKSATDQCFKACAMLHGGFDVPGIKEAIEAARKAFGAEAVRRTIWAYAMDYDWIRGEATFGRQGPPNAGIVLSVFSDSGMKRGLQVFAERWRVVDKESTPALPLPKEGW